jgi:hypothetical protein
MAFNVVEVPEYVEAVKANLKKAPPEVRHVIDDKLAGLNCYFWGGAVRQPVYHVMYKGNGWKTNDWDIIVDDSALSEPLDLDAMFAEELRDPKKCSHNRYDMIKWKPKRGVEIDVSRFSNANLIRKGIKTKSSLAVVLAGCDFNTGSIAYGLRDEKIYDDGAIEGLRAKVIDFNYGDDEDFVLMARLVMHAHDMDFTIGTGGLTFILNRYTDETARAYNKQIREYLRRKGKSRRGKEVVDRLCEIAQC